MTAIDVTVADVTAADVNSLSGSEKHADRAADGTGLRLWPLLAVTVLALLAASAPNVLDPMIRYDDYPAFFADPAGFWPKTLHEGRWVNYVWHLREVVTPAWVNFVLYQALWASFAAAMAVMVVGRGGLSFFGVTLALMVVVAPPAVLISLWFNTLIPGLALVALYVLLACKLSQRMSRVLLPPFVVLTFMAYTTYPLLLLIVALVRTERRSLIDLTRLLALFTASFIGAVLMTYTLNWQFHGVFGVPLAAWREAVPAEDLAGLIANLPKLWTSLTDLLDKSSYGFFPAAIFHLILLVGGLIVLTRHRPLEALYLVAGLITGLTLVAAQVTKLGAIVPPRGFIFVWVIYAIIAVRAAQVLSASPGMTGRLARNAVLLVVGSYLLQIFQQYMTYTAWQQQTREIAGLFEQTEGPVHIWGDLTQIDTAQAAGVQDPLAAVFRVQQVSGKPVISCDLDPAKCAALDRDAGSSFPLPPPNMQQGDDLIWITVYPPLAAQ